MLDDGRVLDVAKRGLVHRVRVGLLWIDLPVFDREGAPLHDRGMGELGARLYFLGLYFLYAMASQLVGGRQETPSTS